MKWPYNPEISLRTLDYQTHFSVNYFRLTVTSVCLMMYLMWSSNNAKRGSNEYAGLERREQVPNKFSDETIWKDVYIKTTLAHIRLSFSIIQYPERLPRFSTTDIRWFGIESHKILSCDIGIRCHTALIASTSYSSYLNCMKSAYKFRATSHDKFCIGIKFGDLVYGPQSSLFRYLAEYEGALSFW